MSTPTRHRRLNPAKRREQILDAANALFAERGYDEVLIEDIARAAGVTRGLVHHYFGGRKNVYIALLERLGGMREETLRPPVGRSARARVADTVSRWLNWTEANRTIYLGTIAPGEDIADPDVRQVVDELMRRAVALVATFHADMAKDSNRLRYALVCWTGLNRAATRRWLRGEANRETTRELLASTLEHALRTFGSPPNPRTAPPNARPDTGSSGKLHPWLARLAAAPTRLREPLPGSCGPPSARSG
jgi:AcrR family transcriptional regulator